QPLLWVGGATAPPPLIYVFCRLVGGRQVARFGGSAEPPLIEVLESPSHPRQPPPVRGLS
ncbi:MAG: hypothetical protein OXI96_03310, partial [Acidimicrobiaceae bacterium]|nr:hypothetical protein [Acidimicrobiaceae bacterium]